MILLEELQHTIEATLETLPCLCIDASGLYIGLQVFFVALLWTTLRPGTSLQFRVENRCPTHQSCALMTTASMPDIAHR